MDIPKVSVVVVNWNTKKYLNDCLESIARTMSAIEYEVLVVDNNSADGSADMVASNFPGVKLIRNKENIGFAKANNIAISAGTGEYVLVLNPDTIVMPGAIGKMTEFMDSNQHVGACGPRIYDRKGNITQWRKRLPSLNRAFRTDSMLGRIFPLAGESPENEITPVSPVEVEWMHGCCMFIRRQTIKEVGLMEEKLFLTFEEQDWCLRMQQKGWKIYHVPAAEIVHYEGESRKQTTFLEDYLRVKRSQHVYFRKHFGLFPVMCLRGFIAMSSLLALLKWNILQVFRQKDPDVENKLKFYMQLFKVSIGLK